MTTFTLKVAWHGAVEIALRAMRAMVNMEVVGSGKKVRFITNGGRWFHIMPVPGVGMTVFSSMSVVESLKKRDAGMYHFNMTDDLPEPRWIARVAEMIYFAKDSYPPSIALTFAASPTHPGKFSIFIDGVERFSDWAAPYPTYYAIDSVVIKVTADSDGDLTFRIWDKGVGTNKHRFIRPHENDTYETRYDLTIQSIIGKPIRFVARIEDVTKLAVNPFGGF